MQQGRCPFDYYPDPSGGSLNAGQIYIGQYGLNPVTNQIPVYWDFNLTIPAYQPLTTMNGIIYNHSTPSRYYPSQNAYSFAAFRNDGSLCYSLNQYYNDYMPSIKNVLQVYTGSVSSIPIGWHLCDGTNGTYDLRDSFIIGAGGTYTPGASVGSNSISLSVDNLPAHLHTYSGTTDPGGAVTPTLNDPGHSHGIFPMGVSGYDGGGGPNRLYTAQIPGPVTTTASLTGITVNPLPPHQHTYSGTTTNTGAGTPVENLPKSYAFCIIQFVGM